MNGTGDGRYYTGDMANCPFCGKPVAIEYKTGLKKFYITHRERAERCPMESGVNFSLPEDECNFRNAINLWNKRVEVHEKIPVTGEQMR